MMPNSLYISNFYYGVTFGSKTNKDLDSRDPDLLAGRKKKAVTSFIRPCDELETCGRRQNDPVGPIDRGKLRSGGFGSFFWAKNPKKAIFSVSFVHLSADFRLVLVGGYPKGGSNHFKLTQNSSCMMPNILFISNFCFEVTFGNKTKKISTVSIQTCEAVVKKIR